MRSDRSKTKNTRQRLWQKEFRKRESESMGLFLKEKMY